MVRGEKVLKLGAISTNSCEYRSYKTGLIVPEWAHGAKKTEKVWLVYYDGYRPGKGGYYTYQTIRGKTDNEKLKNLCIWINSSL